MEGKENSFSVEDIHEVREEFYKKTKDLSSKELIEYINENADEVRKKIKKNKKSLSGFLSEYADSSLMVKEENVWYEEAKE